MTSAPKSSLLETLTIAVVGTVVAVMILHICVDVIGKFYFGAPVVGTITIVTEYYMPVITFIPLALVQKYDQHIAVEVFTGNLPRLFQRHLRAWINLFSCVIFALLAYYGWGEAVTKFRSGAFLIEGGMRFETWPGRFCPPIGFGLISAYLLAQFYWYIRGTDRAAAGEE